MSHSQCVLMGINQVVYHNFLLHLKRTQYYDTFPHDVSRPQSIYAPYVASTNLILIMGLNYEDFVYFEGSPKPITRDKN